MVVLEGTVDVLPSPITREEAAKKLNPPVGVRQLTNYLNLARLYVKGFEEFNSVDGGLNRHAKIYEWHIPTLQKIRQMSSWQIGIKQLELELSKGTCNDNY
ncbi:hypothetical protein [Anabaena azotica]|uniref:Uncharacterized protein n=1 Tax=Anabaena azotica FACHB-119 TaxID=947527 RepID=A0ABR8DGU1_9NOST|nr:hypothetical protein [Anabaena azotica]MBD2505326.1 hypothetical protein [Anabaena azotica FACHB-119]